MSADRMKLLGAWLLRPHHVVDTEGFSMEFGRLNINFGFPAGWVTLAKLLSLSGLRFLLCFKKTRMKVGLDNNQ